MTHSRPLHRGRGRRWRDRSLVSRGRSGKGSGDTLGRGMTLTGMRKLLTRWMFARGVRPPARFLLKGHADVVRCLGFAPDGRTLASGSYDGTVRLWDVATGREQAVLRGHTGWVLAVAFAPDGRAVASGGNDQIVRFWDVATGHESNRSPGGIPPRSSRWPILPMARRWPLVVTTERSNCGTWPPARSGSPSLDTRRRSPPFPSRPTAGLWPRGVTMGPSGCGT